MLSFLLVLVYLLFVVFCVVSVFVSCFGANFPPYLCNLVNEYIFQLNIPPC